MKIEWVRTEFSVIKNVKYATEWNRTRVDGKHKK